MPDHSKTSNRDEETVLVPAWYKADAQGLPNAHVAVIDGVAPRAGDKPVPPAGPSSWLSRLGLGGK